jgi:hypothetical protein
MELVLKPEEIVRTSRATPPCASLNEQLAGFAARSLSSFLSLPSCRSLAALSFPETAVMQLKCDDQLTAVTLQQHVGAVNRYNLSLRDLPPSEDFLPSEASVH